MKCVLNDAVVMIAAEMSLYKSDVALHVWEQIVQSSNRGRIESSHSHTTSTSSIKQALQAPI